MSNKNNTRGSTWQKWDLHIHTPFSELNNQFGGDFDNYAQNVFKKALENNISAIGITDYFCIEGYKKIKNEYLKASKLRKLGFTDKEIKKIQEILILPNIEFRLDKLVDGKRINFHVIFSDNVSSEEIEENFLHELKFTSGGNPQNQDVKQSLKISNLEKLGKKLREEQKEFKNRTDLFIGLMTATINDGDIMEALNKKSFKGNYLVFVPTDELLSKISWTGQDHLVRKTIIQKADGLFSANKNTNAWGLGEKHASKEDFRKEFKTLKPCICGSDAHKCDELFKRDDNKFCWIKAEPTFEGLKQIIYELDGRVKIQELKPEDKAKYNVIDRVEYKNGSEKETISFNQNLNSIIGSKASGKSNLLKNIAYSVDFFECKKRRITKKNFLPLKEFKLFWKDSIENTLDENETKEKGILFIPQGYLGKLAYNEYQNFEEFVVNLFQNKDDFANKINKYKKFEDDNAVKISSIIKELIVIRNSGRNTAEKLKKLGKAKDLKADIKSISKDIDSISKATDKITKKEINNYQELASKKIEKEEELLIIKRNIDAFSLLRKTNIVPIDNIFEFGFSKECIEELQVEIKEYDENFKKNFIDKKIKILKEKKQTKEKGLKEIEEKLKSLNKEIEKYKAMRELVERLEDNKKTKQKIIKLTEKKKQFSEDYLRKRNMLIDNYMRYNTEYKNFAMHIGNLKFSTFKATWNFDTKDFLDFLEENINYHNSLNFKEERISEESKKCKQVNSVFKNPEKFKFNEEEYRKILSQLTFSIMEGSLLLKAGKNEEAVLLDLFKNRFKINYLKSIAKDGKSFPDMSGGEKMLALLEFIFELDDYNYPIILDQPEDDLDVRTISEHIVGFLKSQKVKRQIFIASHNANLVICGDSEEVIVAKKEEKTKFKYKTGAIENSAIKEEIIDVLEGGQEAMKKRKSKLGII